MITALTVGLLSIVSQGAPPESTIYSGASSRVRFAAPTKWHLLRNDATDTSAVIVFHLRNPATDTAGPDRANVVLTAHIRPGKQDIRAFSDAVFANMTAHDAPAVLNDVYRHHRTRSIFWRGQLGSTPYVLLDKFAVYRGVYLTLRFSRPLAKGTAQDWTQQALAEFNALVESITIDREPVFHGDDALRIGPFQ